MPSASTLLLRPPVAALGEKPAALADVYGATDLTLQVALRLSHPGTRWVIGLSALLSIGCTRVPCQPSPSTCPMSTGLPDTAMDSAPPPDTGEVIDSAGTDSTPSDTDDSTRTETGGGRDTGLDTAADTGGYLDTGVPAPNPAIQINSSLGHSCARYEDGSVQCWGLDLYGETLVSAGSYLSVDAGYTLSCAIDSTKHASCWGGLEATTLADVPASAAVEVAAGSTYGCLLLADGALACWGDDDRVVTEAPTGSFTAVDLGAWLGCALGTDSTISCWGEDYDGGVTGAPAGNFSSLGVGEYGGCAVKDGTSEVVCWGSDRTGTVSDVPAGAFRQVAVGPDHACAVRLDRTLACWGSYRYGESTPPAGRYLEVSAGSGFSCAIDTLGYVSCWGYNRDGECEVPP